MLMDNGKFQQVKIELTQEDPLKIKAKKKEEKKQKQINEKKYLIKDKVK